jgi:hypothetical protein
MVMTHVFCFPTSSLPYVEASGRRKFPGYGNGGFIKDISLQLAGVHELDQKRRNTVAQNALNAHARMAQVEHA